MSEEEITQPSPAPAETPTPEPAPQTLDDVYKQFNVDESIQQFTAQPAQNAPAPQGTQAPAYGPPAIPDPTMDPEGYRAYMARNYQEQSALGQLVGQLNGKLSQMEKDKRQQQIDADIGKAVAKVNEKVKADPTLIELALEKKAREDSRFHKLWENRHQNPKAWDAALTAVTGELQGTFSVRTDPQLAENQRALKASQRGMATSNTAPSEGWENLSESEFDQKWNQARRGY